MSKQTSLESSTAQLRVRLVVHEIEHEGDVEASVDDLRHAGCTSISVLDTNFDVECMRVECLLPPGVRTIAALRDRLEFCCL